MKMTTEEAFVKVLQMHGIEHAFGIIGSAMMPISDLFPKAGITFWDCAHETNAALICDGYTRVTGKMGMAIAQNGPGVTGFVTAVKTAYWNHTPMLLVTPQAANRTIGQGGFQEVDQMALFEEMVCYQEEVRDPVRMAEVLNRVIEKAWRGCAPAQINVPRDFWTQVIDVELPQIVRLERPSAGEILFDGIDLVHAGREELRALRRRFQLVHQSPYASLDPRFSVADIVDEPLRAYGVDRATRAARVAALIDQVALPAAFAHRRPAELSGGQRQRVAIARALALRPDLVVLDEAVSALDVSVQAQILALLADIQAESGVAYLFISHDLSVVREISDRVVVMSGGRVVEEGPTARVLTAPREEYTRRLLDAVPGGRLRREDAA